MVFTVVCLYRDDDGDGDGGLIFARGWVAESSFGFSRKAMELRRVSIQSGH
jgi:hypothetical protein